MWREGDETVVKLVETGDGSSVELARTPDLFATAALYPSGEDWYWAPVDGQVIDGLWRRPIAGGQAEQVIDDRWDRSYTEIHFAMDGGRAAISSLTAVDSRFDYRVLDIATGEVSDILGTGHRLALGFLRDELIVYSAAEAHAELRLPLIAIDPADGSERVIVDGEGTFAAIFPDADRRPVLVRDSYETDAYRLYALAEDDQEEHLLFEGEGPPDEPPARMVGPGSPHGTELRGWLPVFPFGYAYLWPGRNDGPMDTPRRLVDREDGSVLEVPVPSAEQAQ